MKKKAKRKSTQKSFLYRGDVGLIVLAGIVVVAFLLGGGIATFTQMNYGIQGNLVTPIPQYNSHESQQLHTLTFTTVTQPPPAPTGINSCNYTVHGSHECDVLYAYAVESTGAGGSGLKIKLYYDDEHAMPIGSGSVTASNGSPGHIVAPINFGTPGVVDPNKYPYYPAVFITDITANANDTSGDAQNGGTPQGPNEIFGMWKAQNGSDGKSNNTNLGSGGDTWPANNGPHCDKGVDTSYTAENIWPVANLKDNHGQPLQSGHSYRVQFAMHDGDDIGDVGDGCVTVQVP